MSSVPSVVCAVDLSPRSTKVVQHASAIAEHFRARLIATTVSPSAAVAVSALEALMREALPGSPDCKPGYDIRVVAGTPSASILRVAHQERADLLVIGTHGADGSRGHALGSTTLALLRHAELPVLVVPNSATDLHSFDDRRELGNMSAVIAPIDFGPLCRRDARIAAGIAGTLGVPLILIHACPAEPMAAALDPDAAVARLSELREEIAGGTPIEALVVHGEPAGAIAAVVAERHVGLVVMGLRGAGGSNGPKPGTIAYRMLCTTPTMLLALPPVLRRHAEGHLDSEARYLRPRTPGGGRHPLSGGAPSGADPFCHGDASLAEHVEQV